MINKVYWLLDEIIAQVDPMYWNDVKKLAREFIEVFGDKKLVHELVDPSESFLRLSRKLVRLPVSTIIDLSGWIGYGLTPFFPNADLVDDFFISRVQDVSTRDFRTAGYIINSSREAIKNKAKKYDLSHILIVDDTFVSGGTSDIVLKTWGIPVENNASVAVLFANVGKVGNRVKTEEGIGRLIYGDSMRMPSEDAEHMLDVFSHPNLKDFLPIAWKLHDLAVGSENYAKTLSLLSEVEIQILFPHRVQEVEIARLHKEDRFFSSPNFISSNESVYSINPNLWVFDQFWKKIDESSIREKGDKFLSIMDEFQSYCLNSEGKEQSGIFLKREATRIMRERKIFFSEPFLNKRERV